MRVPFGGDLDIFNYVVKRYIEPKRSGKENLEFEVEFVYKAVERIGGVENHCI